jgi:hypothetical protein
MERGVDVTKASRAGLPREWDGQNPAPVGKKIDMATSDGGFLLVEDAACFYKARVNWSRRVNAATLICQGGRCQGKSQETTSLSLNILERNPTNPVGFYPVAE